MNNTPLEDALVLATKALLPIAGERARFEARLLMGHVLGVDPSSLGLTHTVPLTSPQMEALERALERRLAHEPISRIIGKRAFWTFEFEISPHTLDPRPDSETLVEAVLARVAKDAPGRIVDFGTGSGCLLISILSERKNLTGVGVDISQGALDVATRNARACGVAERTQFLCTDWDAGVSGPFDIIISNPPYIPHQDVGGLAEDVKNFDPLDALTPGPSGLEAYTRLATACARLLSPHGFCAMEIGQGQEEDVARLFEAQGLHPTAQHKDLQGITRCLVFERKPCTS
ncbi:MAG: peptide chain release factor N(5)-glutamine methyltransferase [Candidatus Puniceispirillum sp.]|nr:peptide chain release factor N(5)-glutamine methyltransferase [Candidatus Puniceispirillum sp.]